MDLALAWREDILAWDLVLNEAGADLLTDDSLYPAIIVSMLSDRVADPDDLLPDGTTPRTGGDPRGYWGDLPLDNAPDYPTPNLWGSRLWLLSRSRQTADVLQQAQGYATEATAWMTEDGVADQVTAAATFPALGRMTISITVSKGGSASTYDVTWAATMSTQSVAGLGL